MSVDPALGTPVGTRLHSRGGPDFDTSLVLCLSKQAVPVFPWHRAMVAGE